MHSSTMRGVFTVAVATGIVAASTRSFLMPRAPQSNQSRSFGPGACGPADPAYLRITNESGGQPFFMSPAEIGKSALVMAASASDDGLFLWATGTTVDAAQGFTIPVDPSISRLSLSATFDGTGGTFSVVEPDGVTVKAGAQTQETVLNCGRLLTIEAPAAGAWRLQVSPTSRFWLIARGRTGVSIVGVGRSGVPYQRMHSVLFHAETPSSCPRATRRCCRRVRRRPSGLSSAMRVPGAVIG